MLDTVNSVMSYGYQPNENTVQYTATTTQQESKLFHQDYRFDRQPQSAWQQRPPPNYQSPHHSYGTPNVSPPPPTLHPHQGGGGEASVTVSSGCMCPSCW